MIQKALGELKRRGDLGWEAIAGSCIFSNPLSPDAQTLRRQQDQPFLCWGELTALEMTASSSESGSLCLCGSSLASDIQSGLTSEGTILQKLRFTHKGLKTAGLSLGSSVQSLLPSLCDVGVGGEGDSKWPLHDTAEDISCLAWCPRDLAGAAGRDTVSSMIPERQLTWTDQLFSSFEQKYEGG